MKHLRRFRTPLGWLMILLVAFWQIGPSVPVHGATLYWDTDGSITLNNAEDGTNLGGSGSWDISTPNWWNNAPLTVWPNTNVDHAIFTGTPGTVTVASGIVANRLTFLSGGYVFNGGTLTLAGSTPTVYTGAGTSTAINTQILGADGLTKSGAGLVYLNNAANAYTGVTTINNGTLVVGSNGALGLDTSTVVVAGTAGPATLFLAGSGYDTGFTLSRNVSISGAGGGGAAGAAAAHGMALVSHGNNTLSGSLTTLPGVGTTNTGLSSAFGLLTLGDVNIGGTSGANFTTFGSVGSIGNYTITGALSGTGSIQKAGSGTLILNPTTASGFSGTIRVASGSVRISSPAALGTNAGTGTSSTLEMNGGVLEVRSDAAVINVGKNVYLSNGSSIFAGRSIGGNGFGSTVTFGALTFLDNENMSFNGRNGYGMTFTSALLTSTADGPTTFTNNLGGLLAFTGNFWNYGETDTARVFTIAGNGNTRIEGNILASGNTHGITKTGTGTLTLTGTASTYTGATSVSGGGTLAISDFRAINNNTAAINLGSTTSAGTLSIIGNDLTLANVTTSKVINLAGTTGGAVILANQTGTSPGLVFNADFTATGAGGKSLTLGGSNAADNIINGAIVDNSAANFTSVRKTGAGTWVLAGTNTYTGSTIVANGTLKIRDTFSGSSRNVLTDASTVGFGLDIPASGTAGGTFLYEGAAGEDSSEAVGPLVAAAGAGTVKVDAGAGGTATLTFSSIDPVLNLTSGAETTSSTTVNVSSTAGIVPGMRMTVGANTVTVLSITNGTQIVVSASQSIAAGTALVFSRANGGGTVNYVPDSDSSIIIGTVGTAGFLNSHSYFRGADFAYAPATTNAVLRAPVYGTDAGFSVASASLVADAHNLVTGNTTSAATTVLSLKIAGSQTVTQTGLLTVRAGAAGTSGGILVTGGSATITGTGVTTGGAADLIIRVDGASDVLNLVAPVTATTTGGLTKTGAGTLIISGQNAYTTGGVTNLHEGTIKLAAGGRLSANSVGLNMRQGTVLDLNGVSTAQSATTSSIGAFNGTGTVTNTSASAVVFAVGGGTTGGTGTFNGSIQEVAGQISVVKMGTSNSQTWNGVSNYTGSTTIGVAGTGTSGSLTVGVLANIGQDSSIGRGDATSTATNQASLIFGGTTGGLIYAGADSAITDRLFTMAGTGASAGATISNNSVLGTLIYSNTNAIAFTGPNAQLLRLGGTSTADNIFNLQITNSGTGTNITSLNKVDAGKWILGNANNTYTGLTTISNGILELGTSGSLSSDSGIVLGATTTVGILEMSGTFTRTLSATPGAGTVTWNSTLTTGGGGFAASTDKLVVAIGGMGTETNLVWGTGGFVNSGAVLALNSATALSEVEFRNAIDLNGAARTITVNDNTNTFTDFATITGVISGTGNLTKNGAGMLQLLAENTYTGTTSVTAGSLVVDSLGHSSVAGGSSVGSTTNANTNAGALILGNGAVGGTILQYVGAGETSNRKIRLNAMAGTNAVANQIYANGTGALILTEVANDMLAGAKTLNLRGTSTAGNMITSVLADNGGALSITVDGAATWILSGDNLYGSGGTTAVNAGALGIGHDHALGLSTLSISNGSVFAYGADRTINNSVTQSATSGTIATFFGEYSLFLNGAWIDPSTTSSGRIIRNNIVSGKVLMINGNYSADAGTTSTGVTFDGSGDTIINGVISTTMTNFGITYAGTGTLTLGGNNTYTGATTLLNGTLILDNVDTNEVIPDGTGKGNVVFNPGAGVTATLDLRGSVETINGLTANSAGNAVIDNTSSSTAALFFGANDQAVNFGTTGTGSYTITDSGTGALSIIKVGSGAATIGAGATLTYQGTTSVTGGSMTINAVLNGSTGLSVTGANSVLALTGGITNPTVITSVTVGDGSTLSLVGGGGNKLNGLTNLSLGNAGGTASILNLDVGDSLAGDKLNTDMLQLLAGGNLTLDNKVVLYLTDAGLNANSTYNLITSAIGGLDAGVWELGGTPGGFSSLTLNVTAGVVSITTGNLVTGALYWNGNGATDIWNDSLNWSTDKGGALAAGTTPGQATNVVFVANTIAGGTLTTTLEQNFKIHSLTFEASGAPGVTPSSVIINPGTLGANRLEIDPSNPALGISIVAGGPSSVTIAAPLKIGANQTWNVTDAGSTLTVSGSLQGEADVTKTGSGRVILSGVADLQFNEGLTSDFVVNGGTLEMQNVGALGSVANNNLANIVVNNGGAFYFFGAASTTVNNITLNGGTLSAGNATQTYSGAINIAADSFINMRDSNSAILTTTARSMVLSGMLTGTGKLTVDSINTVSSGNQFTGTLTLSNNNSGWSGGIDLLRGTVTATNVNALGTGNINASLGRIIFNTAGGTAFNLNQNITLDAPGGILELQADASGTPTSDMVVNFNGTIKLGSASNANMALRLFSATDNFSVLNITGDVVLGANASISTAGSTRAAIISGIISELGGSYSLAVNDDFGGWNQTTNQTLRLLGLNTFTGTVTISAGILEFNTVSNNGGPASSLGMGTNGITLAGGTLSFIGDGAANSQTTNRAINTTASSTLAANGTNGASITYTGAITQVTNNALTLSGSAGSEGFITGGITQAGTTADLTVTGGTWTLSGTTNIIADDTIVSGANAVLNLNTTGVLTGLSGTSNGLYARSGARININANEAYGTATGLDFILLGDNAVGGGTLNTNTFTLTTPRLDVGQATDGFTGSIIGTGTVIVGTSINLYQGSVLANLAGAGLVLKTFGGTITLSGDNSGLTGTTAARVDAGTLILDYATSNTVKLREATGLDMRGGTLVLEGNGSAATTQSVASLTLASGGANKIDVNSNGFAVTLNLGAITRLPQSTDGTIRFELPALGGITTTTANVNGILGGYATVKNAAGVTNFAANDGSGNIVTATSTEQDDVSLWTPGANVSDSSGFFGTRDAITINSLRFNANADSNVTLAAGKHMVVTSGGILMTDRASSGQHSISGGLLSSSNRELIFTQDNTGEALKVSSRIFIGALTKSGNGVLTLSGVNHYSGQTDIQSGMVIASGGFAIGDSSAVVLADDKASTLFLVDDESIGTLSGGSNTSGFTNGLVDVGVHALTLRGGATYAGTFAGSGTIVRNTEFNGSNVNLTGSTTTGFTGSVIVNGGLFQISGTAGRLSGATAFTINKGGALLVDNDEDRSDRISNTAAFTLNSADGTFGGATPVRGLAIRTNDNANRGETIGSLTFGSGANYFSAEAAGGTGSIAAIIADSFARTNNATLNARGRNLGGTANERTQLRIGTTANETAFIGTGNNANLVGGGTGAGTKTISIVPWAIGENLTGTLVDGNMGNSLVTYVAGAGFRALDFSEYSTFAARTGATDNIRESLTEDLTAIPGVEINALVLHSNTAASNINVTGAGFGHTLTVTSGALLFTLNSAATGAHNIRLSGFGGGIAMGGMGITDEYVIHVVNPSSAANTPTLTATIDSSLTSLADITKSGRGTLVLTVASVAGGGAKKTTINEGVLQIGDLEHIGGNTGDIVFAGGTLRLASGFLDDVSIRPLIFLQGGGAIDTNGGNYAFANSIGSGSVGGFTKAGLGTLTLNAAANYRGRTVIATGGLTLGLDNALPTDTDLTVGSGTTPATFTMGGFSQTVSSLSSNANSSTASNIVISSGETLTVNGDVTLYNHADNAVTNLNISGGGAMVVNGGMFIVGRNNTGTDSSSRATLNLSGLSSFTANLSGLLQVQAQGDNNAAHTSSLILSNTANTITASAVQIGASNTAGQHSLVLGGGTNVINTAILEVGSGGRDGGLVSFGGNATGTLTIRDVAGTGRAFFNMGTGTATTSAAATSSFNVNGHVVDLLFADVVIGMQNRGGALTNTFSFDQGTLDMSSLTMSVRTGDSANGTTRSISSTMTLGGGVVNIQNGIFAMGKASGNYAAGVAAPALTATINITGGTVNIGATDGIAIHMGEYTATGGNTTGSASGTVNITGGTVTVNGDIVRDSANANASATVTLNGATAVLDMTGAEIGTAASQVTFTAEQGTLMNLGELNGGAGLTKTGLLTLILEGLNTYTGGTTVSAGVLQVGSGGATGTLGSGTVNIAAANATVRFNRNNTYTVTNNITGTGRVEQTGTGVTVLEGNNDYSGGTSIDAGTLQVNSSGALGTVGEIKFGGGTLQYTANNTADYSTRIANSTGAVRVDTNGQTVTYANTLVSSNTGGLFKTGAGSLRLNAANAYGGATTVDAGRLVANHATALNTGDVTVNAAGTLSVGDGARLNLNVGGSLSSSGTLEFDIFGRQAGSNPVLNNDLITLNSGDTGDSISLTGTLRVVDTTGASATTWVANDMWKLIDWATFASTNIPAASTSYGGFSALDLPTLAAGLGWNVITDATGLYISVAIVPEPSRMLLLALGFVVVIFRRRRR